MRDTLETSVHAGVTVQVAAWMTPAGQLNFERVGVPRSVAEATGGRAMHADHTDVTRLVSAEPVSGRGADERS